MKRHPNEQIIYALFENEEALKEAFAGLVKAGIKVDDISVLLTENAHESGFSRLERTKAPEGAMAGGLLGGAIGGVIGGLAAFGAVTGVGLLVMGPALAFAAAGGLLGGLLGHGVPEEEANWVKEQINSGKAMLAVHVNKPEEMRISRRVLAQHQGDEVEFHKRRIGELELNF